MPDESPEVPLAVEPHIAVEALIAPVSDPIAPVEIAEPDWQSLDPRHLTMEVRASWIFLIGFSVVACTVSAIVGFWWSWTSIVFLAIAAGFAFLLGLTLWSIWVIVPRSHRAAGWMLSSRGIEIRKGIWWRHIIVIPKQRIQHSDLRQGPILRAYGLANLVIFTAGTENAQVELVGLSFEKAQWVRDRLLEITHENVEGV